MSRFSSGRWAASGWAMSVATLLVLGGCSGEAPTDPAPLTPGSPAFASAAVPIHDHGVDFSFAGEIPCADFGIAIQAEFDYDITVDVTAFPEVEAGEFVGLRLVRFHFRQVVLTHRNLETGKAVTSRNASNEVYDLSGTGSTDISDAKTVTITGLSFNFKDPDGGILIKNVGRLIFGESGVVFEAGQHPELEPDFITFMCTALS
jgi:hypothetical protein